MAHRTIRFVPILALVGVCIASPCGARAQQPQLVTPLTPLQPKVNLTQQDRTLIEDWVGEQIDKMTGAQNPADRAIARELIVNETTKGTPQFREAAAAIVAGNQRLQASLRGNSFDAAVQCSILLVEIQHPATRDALRLGLESKIASVRLNAAKGIQQLQDKLTDPAVYRPILLALAQAGENERAPAVLRKIYQAINFPERVANFTGAAEVTSALARVFKARLERVAANPQADIPGHMAAARAGTMVTQPPVSLMASLARVLKTLVEESAKNQSPVCVEAVEECETAIRAIMAKFPGTAPPPKLTDVARSKPSDAQALGAALARYIGAKGTTGALNVSPWNLPAGLP